MNARRLAALALAAQLSMVLVGCGKQDGSEPKARTGRDAPVIRIDGSSTVFPIAEAVAEEFQIEQRGAVRVTVGLSGTGGGFKKLCRGDIDISNASRPILTEEIEMCRAAGINFIELPVAFDAITVVVNPKNDWVKSLTVADLKKMWEPGAQGQVTRWNQVRPEWPDAPLMLFGPGADSGTFDYFTEAVSGKAKSSRGDYTASEDDNVLVQGVENNKNALGYFGFAYYIGHKDKMRAVPIQKEDGIASPAEQCDRRRRHLSAAVASAVHLCERQVGAASRSAPADRVLPDRRPGARGPGRLRRTPRASREGGAPALHRRPPGHGVRRCARSGRHHR